MNLECAGERLILSAQRALYWPARGTLIIADTHFGKDEIFRRAGRPIPEAITTGDLLRIAALLQHHDATRLVVLGDFFHGSPRHSQHFSAGFSTWLQSHPRLQIEIVAGNHDRHGGAGTWSERIHWHREPLIDGPFALCHHVRGDEAAYVLSGHVHPVVRLRSVSGDRTRVPVFRFGSQSATLPAFGSFTGGAEIRPEAGERVIAIIDQELFEVAP